MRTFHALRHFLRGLWTRLLYGVAVLAGDKGPSFSRAGRSMDTLCDGVSIQPVMLSRGTGCHIEHVLVASNI